MTAQDNLSAWRGEVNASLKELLIEVRQRPTRPEIEALLSTKVSADVFSAELKAVREDIEDLRDKPKATRDWIGTAAMAGGCAISAIVGLLGIAVPVVILIVQHWH